MISSTQPLGFLAPYHIRTWTGDHELGPSFSICEAQVFNTPTFSFRKSSRVQLTSVMSHGS